MNILVRSIRLAILAVASLLAACSSIGEGSTVRSLQIIFAPVDSRDQAVYVDDGTNPAYLRMFTCLCANVGAFGTFTDGTLAGFSTRARWKSSNPAVVSVANVGDTVSNCPFTQRFSGALVPGVPGTATITAEFLGITASMNVQVTGITNGDTFGLDSMIRLTPVDINRDGAPDDPALVVGSLLPLRIDATLDGRRRALNDNVTSWTTTAAAGVATIDGLGRVAGLGPDGGTPITATANFASCDAAMSAPAASERSASLRVVDTVTALSVEREPNLDTDGAADGSGAGELQQNSNEFLKATATLDLGSSMTATQDLSGQSKFDYTDPCTTRVYTNDPAVTSHCTVNASATCGSSVPVCATITDTSCPDTLTTACRVTAAPMSVSANRVLAQTPSASATTFSAAFPFTGVATTLTAGISAADTVLTVATLISYPTVFPWYATIDSETVKVTAATGTTLTVERAYGGTLAATHAMGATFMQRVLKAGDNTVQIQAVPGTLSSFTIDAPGPFTPYAVQQFNATGTYIDATVTPNTTRTQRVTHLPGSPAMVWFSSNTNVAQVATIGSSSGQVAAQRACGGKAVIRARASSSTDTVNSSFATTITTTDGDSNGNDDANDAACAADPLCDQVTVTVPRADPLPPGVTTAACDAAN